VHASDPERWVSLRAGDKLRMPWAWSAGTQLDAGTRKGTFFRAGASSDSMERTPVPLKRRAEARAPDVPEHIEVNP